MEVGRVKSLDLRPMHNPITISLPRAIRRFSRMIAVGLKHLCQLDTSNRPRGILLTCHLFSRNGDVKAIALRSVKQTYIRHVGLSMDIHVSYGPRWEVKRLFS
jgi:hypothetical protein